MPTLRRTSARGLSLLEILITLNVILVSALHYAHTRRDALYHLGEIQRQLVGHLQSDGALPRETIDPPIEGDFVVYSGQHTPIRRMYVGP